MKITAIEIKPGMIIEHKNDLWNVLKTQHVKPGKGGAFNQVELKSVMKGTKLNVRFRSSENVEKAEVDEKKFNFLYSDEENSYFMDNISFEQISILNDIIGDKVKLLKENLEVVVLMLEEKPLSIELPKNINCTVETTDAVVKGQTAASSYKPAKLDNGLTISVPPFIENGDKIIIDSRNLEYVKKNN
jgi:elongation factor P